MLLIFHCFDLDLIVSRLFHSKSIDRSVVRRSEAGIASRSFYEHKFYSADFAEIFKISKQSGVTIPLAFGRIRPEALRLLFLTYIRACFLAEGILSPYSDSEDDSCRP